MKSPARLLCALLVCGLTLAGSVAHAVTGTMFGDHDPATYNEGQHTTGDDARRVMDQFAGCLVVERRAEVMRALAMADNTKGQFKALRPTDLNDCLSDVEVKFDLQFLRASYYKALFARRFVAKAPDLAPTPPDFKALDAAIPLSTSDTVRHGVMLNVADCAVRANPEAGWRLLQAVAGSPREQEAITAVAAGMSGCIPGGMKMALNKGLLIGLIAEAYYRDAVTPLTSGAQ